MLRLITCFKTEYGRAVSLRGFEAGQHIADKSWTDLCRYAQSIFEDGSHSTAGPSVWRWQKQAVRLFIMLSTYLFLLNL